MRKRTITSKLKLIGISTVVLLLFFSLAPVVQATGSLAAVPWEGSWGPRFIIPTTVWQNEVDTYDANEFAGQFNQLTSSRYVFVNLSHPASGKSYTSPHPELTAALDAIVDANPLYVHYFSAYYDVENELWKEERFSERDVLGETLDLIDASGRKAIVYFATGGFMGSDKWDPPFMDYVHQELGAGTSRSDGVREFIVKYFAQKFGDKIDGWWFDGSNQFDELEKQEIKDAVRSGNPNALVTYGNHELNDYVGGHPTPRTIAQASSYDYNYQMLTRIEAGPWMDTDHLPVANPVDGQLGHIFSHPQHNWTGNGTIYFTDWQAANWNRRSVDAGGMFSWSIPRESGTSMMYDLQFQMLRKINTVIGGAEFLIDSFETGFGDWTDGGADCSHYAGPYASHATSAIKLTGNTATSLMSTDDLPMSGSSTAAVDLGFYATGFGTGDRFELQISTNSGSNYTTVKAWTYNTEFAYNSTFLNDEYNNDLVHLESDEFNFNDQTRFRFRCYAASGNVYIDDIRVDAITTNPPPPLPVDPKPVFICDPIIKYWRNYAKEGFAYETYAGSPIITGSAVDGNGDTLTYSKVSGPAWLLVASNGYLSGTPGAGNVGINEFTVEADDGTGNTTTAQLIITVEANMAPSFTIDPINGIVAIVDTAVSSSIADDAEDVEDDPMTFSKVSGPAWLSVAGNGDLSGTPGTGDLGLNTFTVQVVAEGGSDTATLNITVHGTPDIYEAEDATVGGPNIKSTNPGYTGTGYIDFAGNSGEYVEWTVTVPSGDVCDIAFRYALGSKDRPLEIQVNGQVVDPLLSFADTGSWSTWSYTASLSVTLNAGANTVRTTVTGSSGGNIDHLAVFYNYGASFASDPINEMPVKENVAYSSSIADDASDPDSDPMTFSKVSGPAWLSVASNGDLSGTPGTGDIGHNSWTVQVDAIDGSNQATLNITVYAEGALYEEDFSFDPGYVSANLSAIGAVGSTYTYFTFDEYNGTPDIGVTTDTGVLHFDSNTSGGSARSRGLSVFIDTSAALAGTYTVSFDVSNWVAGMGTAGFSVREGSGLNTSYMELDNSDNNSAGSTPNFKGPAASTLLGTTGAGGTGISGNGTVSVDVTLTEAGQSGDYLALAWVQVRSTSDAVAPKFDVDNVVVDMSGGNQAPSFTSDPINEIDAIEDAAYSSSIADDASDTESDPMTFSKVSGPAWLSVAENGTLSGTPDDSNVGANIFIVQVDATGGSATATLNITVANVYSGVKGIEDLIGFAGQWLSVDCADIPACNGADLDDDTNVKLSDFSIFAQNWTPLYIPEFLVIDPATGVTASSVYSGIAVADDHIVDGSGLSDGEHTSTWQNNMWLSSGIISGGQDSDPSVTFDLGAVYTISRFHVWNYNQANFSACGVNSVSVEYGTTASLGSTVAGITNFAQATGADGYTGEEFDTFTPFEARYIKFNINSNHGNVNLFYGLSEVQFYD